MSFGVDFGVSCALLGVLPLALGEVEGDGCALLQGLEEYGLLLCLLGDEVGDGEDVGEGTEYEPVLDETDEDAAEVVDAGEACPLQQLGQQGAEEAEEDGDAHPDEDEGDDAGDAGRGADVGCQLAAYLLIDLVGDVEADEDADESQHFLQQPVAPAAPCSDAEEDDEKDIETIHFIHFVH